MPPKERYVGRHRCPHCNGPAPVRTIRSVTPTVQEHYLRCADKNPDQPCGWTGVASFEIIRTTTQSAKPNPQIVLPTSAPRARPALPPKPANDDFTSEAAEAL